MSKQERRPHWLADTTQAPNGIQTTVRGVGHNGAKKMIFELVPRPFTTFLKELKPKITTTKMLTLAPIPEKSSRKKRNLIGPRALPKKENRVRVWNRLQHRRQQQVTIRRH